MSKTKFVEGELTGSSIIALIEIGLYNPKEKTYSVEIANKEYRYCLGDHTLEELISLSDYYNDQLESLTPVNLHKRTIED